jgi:hypothetical protein
VKLLGAFDASIEYVIPMTRLHPAALAIALISCAPSPPAGQQGPAIELAGRIAGPPQRCVSTSSADSFRRSEGDPHLLLYGSARVIWANALGPHCSFRSDDILVTEPTGSSYCRGDIVRSIDRQSHIPGPACVLGDFVPYRRP